MVVRRVAMITVFAMLAVGFGGVAGAEEIADDEFNAVAAAGADGTLLVQQDPGEVTVPQNPLEFIGAYIRWMMAHAGVALGGEVMRGAIALGPAAFGWWQIGKNIWDAACVLGEQADRDMGVPNPTFIFICTLYPRWPF